MAFVTVNGFDVEHASNLLVYENLYPEIQHLNGKGVTDKYTKDDVKCNLHRCYECCQTHQDLENLEQPIMVNGTIRKMKVAIRKRTRREHYTIPVDLVYDEGVLNFNKFTTTFL